MLNKWSLDLSQSLQCSWEDETYVTKFKLSSKVLLLTTEKVGLKGARKRLFIKLVLWCRVESIRRWRRHMYSLPCGKTASQWERLLHRAGSSARCSVMTWVVGCKEFGWRVKTEGISVYIQLIPYASKRAYNINKSNYTDQKRQKPNKQKTSTSMLTFCQTLNVLFLPLGCKAVTNITISQKKHRLSYLLKVLTPKFMHVIPTI